jgi:hypothetical protein
MRVYARDCGMTPPRFRQMRNLDGSGTHVYMRDCGMTPIYQKKLMGRDMEGWLWLVVADNVSKKVDGS